MPLRNSKARMESVVDDHPPLQAARDAGAHPYRDLGEPPVRSGDRRLARRVAADIGAHRCVPRHRTWPSVLATGRRGVARGDGGPSLLRYGLRRPRAEMELAHV